MSATILTEDLGPRGRQRVRVAAAVALVLLVAVLVFVLYRFWAYGILAWDQWEPFTVRLNLGFLFEGLLNTFRAALTAGALSVTIGFVFALGRLARAAPVRWLSRAYVELFRSIPLLLLIFAAFFGLPALGVDISRFWALVVGLVVYNSAVLAEIYRAGILSLDRGQTEAALAIGLRYWSMMGLVILPQAIRRMVPAIVAQIATLTKDTALGFVIGYEEFLRRGQNFGEFANNLLPSYIFVAAVYFVLVYLLARLARRLEVRQRARYGAGKIEVGGGIEDIEAFGEEAEEPPSEGWAPGVRVPSRR